MINNKHIPIIYMQFAHAKKHLYKIGCNEQQVKNYIELDISINQQVLERWGVL